MRKLKNLKRIAIVYYRMYSLERNLSYDSLVYRLSYSNSIIHIDYVRTRRQLIASVSCAGLLEAPWNGVLQSTLMVAVGWIRLFFILEIVPRSSAFISGSGRLLSWSILDPSAYGFGNARVSSGKLCAGVAKIWLFGPHSACSLIKPKLFASFISTSSRKSCAASVLELKKFS